MRKWFFQRFSLSFLILFLTLGFSSCKKEKFTPNNTGKNVLPQEDLLDLKTIDTTITILTKPVYADSIRTDEVSTTALLGSYVDPVFGKSEAAIYAQFRISDPVDFRQISGTTAENVQVDKVELSIPYTNLYGKNSAQTFEVFQLTEEIDLASEYYSNSSIPKSNTNLVSAGQETQSPDKETGTIILPLDNAFGESIVQLSGSEELSTKENFAKWLKGLYIGVNNSMQTSDEGAILNTNIGQEEAIKFTIYYSDADNVNVKDTFDILVDGGAAYFSAFSHDYSGAEVESKINTESLNDFYLQPMQGINTEVTFPYINNLNKIDNIIIRRAELILPYQENADYAPSGSILPLNYNKSGETVFIVDQFTGSLGGSLNSSKKKYTLNITNFVNRILKGDIDDERLLIVPVGAALTANRTVFKGQSSTDDNKIQLKISYSTF